MKEIKRLKAMITLLTVLAFIGLCIPGPGWLASVILFVRANYLDNELQQCKRIYDAASMDRPE